MRVLYQRQGALLMGGPHYQTVTRDAWIKCWRVRVRGDHTLLGCLHYRTRLSATIAARYLWPMAHRRSRLVLAPSGNHWRECTHGGIVDPS